MAGKGAPSQLLMFVGAIMSFFYIAFGIAMLMGYANLFSLEPAYAKMLGGAIAAYGLFRLYLFIQRFKQMRDEE
jgi:hypothetical protein